LTPASNRGDQPIGTSVEERWSTAPTCTFARERVVMQLDAWRASDGTWVAAQWSQRID
jgi:hypothetical protein